MSVAKEREPTIAAAAFWPVIDYLRARGHDPDRILASGKTSIEELRNGHARIPHARAMAMYLSIRAGTDEAGLGLRFSSFVKGETFAILEYAARASATVRDAIEVTNRYARLIDDSFAFRLEPAGAYAFWRLDMSWPEPVRGIVTEYVLGIVSRASRMLFGTKLPSKEVWLRTPAPRDTRVYEELLATPVRFSAPDYGLLMFPELLERRPNSADPVLANLLGQQAESMLAGLRRESLCDEVRRVVSEELRSGAPAMDRIARRLATTPSTLRRRLSDEGVRYKDLLEAARRESACTYLSDQQLTVTEIAFRLGYRDATTFFKVFKRWTGQTPAEYRKNLVGCSPNP
ncbi:AraC family transcriptional regulator ligand-binding domain-containing protein [Pendulispora rubella]|uniref:AraC family transcriptional regulator ligand-binding domain-containing protein n=1 Tax=Pendulispora rubella TaxID=2741070 RepID=A0ABZ2LB93_9BACT